MSLKSGRQLADKSSSDMLAGTEEESSVYTRIRYVTDKNRKLRLFLQLIPEWMSL